MKSYFKPYRLAQAFLVMAGVYCYHISYSQSIQNVDFTVSENKVIVTYDLVDCPSYKSYDIKLYYSDGNRYLEANSVTGSLFKQSCGRYKSITWDVLNDRNELKGSMQVEVRITKLYSTKIKTPLPRDNGYFGILLGGFSPMGSFGAKPGGIPSDNLEQAGFSADLSYTYESSQQFPKYKKFIGVTCTLRYSDTGLTSDWESDETTWYNVGFTIGPLISFPLSKTIVWDIRPMIGYSQTFTFALSQNSVFFNNYGSDLNTGGFSTNLGTAIRFNVSTKMNFLVGVDYFTTNPQFENNITRNIKTLGISFGIGARFN